MEAKFTYILYTVAVVLLTVSFFKDKNKTFLSLKKSWKMFVTVLPQFVSILLLVSFLLALLSPETIKNIIGTQSGFLGMLISSLVGAIALVPVIIAFPIASELLKNGAGIAQMTIFISTLTTVGFVTLQLETKYLGKKIALLRNMLFYLFSFLTAYIVGVVLS